MLINDFLKFNCVSLPNDSLAKKVMNKRFSTKTTIKNIQDNFMRVNGIKIAEKVVATIHVKIILRRLLGLNDWLTVGNPASSYSFPYFSINSQKCGICQINKKKPIKTMVELNKSPPAAVQPINAGTAPTSEPGTTANEVTLFKLV